jgi:hypothetical protein
MNKFFLVSLFLMFSVGTYALELSSGVISKGRDTVRNDEQKRISPIIKSVIKDKSPSGLSRSIGYTNLGAGDNWFRLNKDLTIKGVNVETKQYLGSWPLATLNSCDKNDQNCIEPWWEGRWSDQEFLEPEIKKRLNNYDIKLPFELSYGDDISDAVGCLEHTPLRYGDIDSDNNSELVVFLKNSFVIFSPKEEKVIFSSLFNYLDFVTWQTLIDAEMYLDAPTNSTPQYASLLEFKKDRNAIIGYRGYSKLFIQDFDNNQNADLVVWRKLYQSRLQGDNIKGFEKLSDSYLHYKKVNGEYQLQTDTAPETIQGWLTAKNLTWQKGFPSKSECAGQEGQLIPEMHDPLLNDPDVLK